MDKLLSATEVAEVLGVSVHTVYAWIGLRRIPFVKLGRRTLFDPEQVHDWVQRSSKPETAQSAEGSSDKPLGPSGAADQPDAEEANRV